MASTSDIKIQGVTKRFDGGLTAVENLSLDIPAGQFVSLLGPSGCGKSTLLRMIGELERPSEGTIQADSGGVGFVFQDAHLLPWRRVIDNVALPLELAGTDKVERRGRAEIALKMVGLPGVERLYPNQLSGGMRMRVSLARALIGNPSLLLLDEPFAALDEISRQQLDDLLRDLWQQSNLTVIFVTHSIHEAAYLSERVIVLTRRPSRIVIDHSIDLRTERQMAIRATASFAAEAQVLFDALRRGEQT
jgi:NitT/TauT family transport system ATP-binding protein